MLFGTALVVVTMFVVLAMVALSRWCYKDKKVSLFSDKGKPLQESGQLVVHLDFANKN